MKGRFRTFCLLQIVIGVGICARADADRSWYAGDLHTFSARNTVTAIPERIQQGIDAGLDWIVLSGQVGDGLFIGLRDIAQEYELNSPRITPIPGTGWGPDDPSSAMILFGLDPRSPVPQGSIQQVVTWGESHGGVSVFARASALGVVPEGQWQTVTAFQGIHNGEWAPQCEPGAEWDRILTSGRRLFVVGGGDTSRPGLHQKTYVWAENNLPRGIAEGLRNGSAYVAQADGIHIDFQVNGSPMGATVPVSQEAYIRLRASARHPISRVLLVSDGEVVWTAHPDVSIWENRLFIPVADRSYLRVILESEEGAYRTVGNPVFLIPDGEKAEGEIHESEPGRLVSEAIFLGVDGTLEVAADLEVAPQRRILGELLRDTRLRYAAARVLQDREDLIPDPVLWDLLGDPDSEVRLGAAYALAVRSPPDFPDVLADLLEDSDSGVREYAARMVLQYTEALDASRWSDLLADPDPQVRLYLIRALSPALFDGALTAHLIATTRSEHSGISAAAVDKLVEMGIRNYRIIKVLLDSARAGNHRAVEPLAAVRDRRTIPELEAIFLQESYGPLKRAAFLALEGMGSPYICRKEAVCPPLLSPPSIDGYLEEGEWEGASTVLGFAGDGEGAPPDRGITALVAHDSARLYLSVSCEVPGGLPPAARARLRDDPGIGGDDRLEWSLSLPGEEREPFVLCASPLGAVLERRGQDAEWNPSVEIAHVCRPGQWTVECGIPLAELGIGPDDPPPPLRFNVALVEGRPTPRRWVWSVTYDDPDNPDRFGDLTFGTPVEGE